MKRIIKRTLIIVGYMIILMTTNCLSYTIEDEEEVMENQERYNIKTYSVSENEDDIFNQQLKTSYSSNGILYTLQDIEKSGGNVTDKKEIVTTKQIITETENKNKIINELPETLEYNENGYIGQYELNEDSLNVEKNYNGYSEYIVEEMKQYSNLERNDLTFIPKQITKDGMKLDLLNTEWNIQTTKNMGNTIVGDKYIANCYYAGKIKRDNPYSYTVTATYTGIAEKTEEKPYIYTVSYKMEEIENQPILEQEEPKIDILPILGVSSIGIIIVICFIFVKNAKIYNLQNGHWKLVGKMLIIKPKIDLTKFSSFEVTNKYKIELSKSAIKKIGTSPIQIVKNSNMIEHKIKPLDKKSYTFEVTI